MGKEENLCDDSVIIKAFDDAISKYKAMHGQTISSTSDKEGEICNDIVIDESHKPIGFVANRPKGEDEKSNIESNIVIVEVAETTNMSPVRENISDEPCIPIACADLSNVLHAEETLKESIDQSELNSKTAEDYNQLLSQYYELEDKRQKILERLYLFGGWNYQDVSEGSGSGIQWGATSTYTEHSVSASQTSQKHVLASCFPSSYPIPDVNGTDTGAENPSLADSDIIKTAMDAAERAISSMKTKIPGHHDVNKEKEREKHDGNGTTPHSASSETDLAAVLNAWYSAGFYTGKYLVEQSYAKK